MNIIPSHFIRRGHRWALIAAALWLTAFSLSAAPQEASAPGGSAGAPGVPLRVLNREVMVFRAGLGTYSAEQRATAARARIEQALLSASGARTESALTPEGAEMRVRGQTVFLVTTNDVNALAGETLASVVQLTESRLALAVAEVEEVRDRRGMLGAVARGVMVTVLLGALIWFLARNRERLEERLVRVAADKAGQIRSHTLRLAGRQNVVGVLRGTMTVLFWAATAIASVWWLEYSLRLFPQTRPFGEQLEGQFLGAISAFGHSALRSLPNLGIVCLVGAMARFAHTAARRFFTVVARGRLHTRLFDPTTAPIAQRLCLILIWVTAVIVAFPYIPGSQTPAFQGISVLAGLMLSLGSGNLIAQLVGGLVMVYNRSCRPGDFVRIGELEGTITAVGFFSARLVTGRNEEIVVPNSQIAGAALINYSRRNDAEGVQVPVSVTIGYNTSWRQVHAMLLTAAGRTQGLKTGITPVVLQRRLCDFYVEYELRVTLESPASRTTVLSELNGHIQDVFNEFGVQIMSPHYEADPAQPVVVPRDRWHAPPADRPGVSKGG